MSDKNTCFEAKFDGNPCIAQLHPLTQDTSEDLTSIGFSKKVGNFATPNSVN